VINKELPMTDDEDFMDDDGYPTEAALEAAGLMEEENG
jgi:hypothetical protein